MAKTIYEGLRIGKNGGERWTGTVARHSTSGRIVTGLNSKPKAMTASRVPKGGSVFSRNTTTKK